MQYTSVGMTMRPNDGCCPSRYGPSLTFKDRPGSDPLNLPGRLNLAKDALRWRRGALATKPSDWQSRVIDLEAEGDVKAWQKLMGKGENGARVVSLHVWRWAA